MNVDILAYELLLASLKLLGGEIWMIEWKRKLVAQTFIVLIN